MADRRFGHIPGVTPGTWFPSRRALHEAGVHRPLQAGISGAEDEGADSIVLSGGYEDDVDRGDVILYTGQGGRDPATEQQVEHQPLNRGNLALARSAQLGLPIRVIRGAGAVSAYAPESGYRYDGLYRVEDYWKERGASGFFVWRYKLIKDRSEAPLTAQLALIAEEAADALTPLRTAAPRWLETHVQRIVRDTEAGRAIKRLYDYRCQVCGERLEGAGGPYAEAAHLRPLGHPHLGPDTLENLLCLCPNHHVLFDYGGFTLRDDLTLIGLEGALIVHPEHTIDGAHVRLHRTHRAVEAEDTS